ncbi:ATPase-like protein [Saccharothrix espanaensis DSM 44229]|uniref:ATPase-like protein n=1 Tax=Saccharothrix espanaensis (strain ATCC 51144 / DSM 44229 / JCM 9112 / NBRC 15066 / NRRL 15764) TaxID=1179773 RepID=K0K339_SACES|nr:ATPase-like protein [Saccharothrix espanaensis DSM 44229]
MLRLRSAPCRTDPDPAPGQLFAALTAAHAGLSGSGLVFAAWQRDEGDPQVRVLFGGSPGFPPGPGTGVVGDVLAPLYPPGSTAEVVDSAEVVAGWRSFPAWVRCTGRFDALRQPVDDRRRPPSRGAFDDYVAHLGESFVWLTAAQPLPAGHVDDELSTLEVTIPVLRRETRLESSRIALHRAEGSYRELSRALPTGLWAVHVLVAGRDTVSARRVAALLCGASDLDDLPYTLAAADATDSFERALTAVVPRSPFPASGELLAALARPPKQELPGIRLTEPARFDLTPETSGFLELGTVLDDADQAAGRFTVAGSTLNRHTFVAGSTGAGKSQTVRHLLERLHHAGVPWLVVEPAKAEYAAMAGRIGEDVVTVIRPGAPDAVPVGLNPLEPEPGFPIQTHIDLVRALFLAAFDADEPFPQVLSLALNRCYTELGWNTVVGGSRLPGVTPKYPTLADLRRAALEVVEGVGYGKEVTDNVRGFIDVRLGGLRLGTPGRFFEGGHPLDVTDLLRRNVVLEIEDVGNDQDKAFFIGAVLIRLHEHLRSRRSEGPSGGLRHVTVLEEAHRLLKRAEPGSPTAHAVELFTALLAEIRAYGEGIVVAEQIPSKIVPDVVKNTALKIVHRLPAADDRDVVGATMNLDEAQSRHVVSLPPGRAVVFADGMDRPVRLSVPLGEDREKRVPGRAPAIRDTRSVACGPTCRARACLLREVDAGATAAEDPRLVLWIELLVVAHLVGRPAPRPERKWLVSLTARFDARTLECAIAHRVQTAVDLRYTGLAAHYQPEALAEHVAASALATVRGDATTCDGAEAQWQAGKYRWLDVVRALVEAGPDTGPHPDTASWADRGLHLTGDTAAEQLTDLEAHPDSWLPDDTVITGAGTPPVHEQALAELSRVQPLDQRFLAVTGFLGLSTTWPLATLNLTDQTQGDR